YFSPSLLFGLLEPFGLKFLFFLLIFLFLSTPFLSSVPFLSSLPFGDDVAGFAFATCCASLVSTPALFTFLLLLREFLGFASLLFPRFSTAGWVVFFSV